MADNQNENINIQIPEIYSNAAVVHTSPYEFEITPGLGSSNYQGVKPVVNLRLSPQFAKEFGSSYVHPCTLLHLSIHAQHSTLVENLNLYEETHGKIKVPKREEEKV